MRSWISRAIGASALPTHERLKLAGATTHWLHHNFGARAIAREVSIDVIQAQMEHASIQTTASIYGRAPIKRRVDELGRAFSGGCSTVEHSGFPRWRASLAPNARCGGNQDPHFAQGVLR